MTSVIVCDSFYSRSCGALRLHITLCLLRLLRLLQKRLALGLL